MSFTQFNPIQFAHIDGVENYPYAKLADLYAEYGNEEIFSINAFFINTSPLQITAPLVIDAKHKLKINIPPHMTSTFMQIKNTPSAINDINDGKAGFKIREYKNKQGMKCYTITFADIN